MSKFENYSLRRSVFHCDYSLLGAHRFPLAGALVLERIRRIEFFDIEILLIDGKDR